MAGELACGFAALFKPPHDAVIAAAFIKDCNITAVTSTSIGYVLSPRINAAGRLGHSDVAAALLLTEDPAEAEARAAELCALSPAIRITPWVSRW